MKMSLLHFLEQRYPAAFNLAPVACKHKSEIGKFSLYDPKACKSCLNPADCDHINLYIQSKEAVTIVDFEDFADKFDKTEAAFIGGKCDLLLFSEETRQIALCDLTCSKEEFVKPNAGKYPQGKQAKAFQQMSNSLHKLVDADILLKLNIITNSRKSLIFGWRDPEITPMDKAEKSMSDFGLTPASEQPVIISLQRTDFDFTFIQVKYPATFIWDINIMP